MIETELRSRRLILFAVAALICGTALAWGLYLVRDALQLVYFSFILALGFSPMVRWIEQRKWFGRSLPRWTAILAFYVVLLSVVAVVLNIIVPAVVAQARDLAQHVPEYNERVQSWLVSKGLLQQQMTMAELATHAPSPNATFTGLLGAVNQVVEVLLTAFTVLLLSFYFLMEGEDLYKGLLRGLQPEARPRWWRIGNDAPSKVGGWLQGQFLLCVMIGGTSAIGFWLIGLPYFYVLALICGVAELIPIIGPIVAAVPAIAVGATVGVNSAVIVAVFLFVQQQIENNVIIPRLMQKQTGISPILVMIAILIGGSLLGVLGALLAVPTAAVIQILVREYFNSQEEQQ